MLLAIGARSLRWLPAKVEAFLARMPDRPVEDPLAGGRDAGRAALDGGGPGGETAPMRLPDHRVSRNPAQLFGDLPGRMALSPKAFHLSAAGFRPLHWPPSHYLHMQRLPAPTPPHHRIWYPHYTHPP